MKLLRAVEGDGTARCVALFGNGLIGSAVLASLERQRRWMIEDLPHDWRDAALRRQQQRFLLDLLHHHLRDEQASRCDIVWTAGANGFASSEQAMRAETDLVGELAALATALAERLPHLAFVVHLTSSAGGLFEGQRHVGPATQPGPLRPYGQAKLEQEALIAALGPAIATCIYRPSSVYGFVPHGRAGLFSTLIGNGMSDRRSRIFGHSGTIRDYVRAEDVGGFIAGRVAAPPSTGTYLLASGKPTSVHEALVLIERTLGRPLHCQFDTAPSNARHLSFLPSALPPGWRATPLETGLSRLADRIGRAARAHVH